jgi:hypothetical protein
MASARVLRRGGARARWSTAVAAASIGVVSLLGLTPQRAEAAVSTQWVQIPISDAAKAADPTLNNFRTYDLKVTQTGGEHWVGAELEVQLTSGKFYVPASNNQLWAKSDLWSSFPNLEFDTFVTSPDSLANPSPLDGTSTGGHILILGTGGYPAPGQPGVPATMPDATNSKDVINIAYGDLYSNWTVFGDGTYTVARLTVSNDASADIGGRVMGNYINSGQVNNLYYPPVFRVVPVPEPTMLGTIGLATGALLSRRRRGRAS